LAYVEAILTFRGRSLLLRDTILDTGSSSTIFSADRLLEIGVTLSFVDYAGELGYFAQEVIPRLERLGVRRPR
jgi:hypothetical protein